MNFKIEKFKNMPYVAKVGSVLWMVGWIWLIAVYYYLTKDTAWVAKLSIAVAILGLFIFQAQNWARLIAVLGNVMVILLTGHFFYVGLIPIAIINVILHGGTIFLLMVPTTSRYFKIQSQPEAPKDVGSR